VPETDTTLQLLRSLADVGVTPPDRRAVRDRVRTAVSAELSAPAAGRSGSGLRGRRRVGWGRPVGGALALGLSVLGVVVVAVGAIALIAHGSGPESIDPDFRQREVRFGGGPRLWVIPGANGMEVVSGPAGSAVTSVAAAVRDGAGFSSSDPDVRVDVIPKTTSSVTVTVRGVRHTFDPAYGVYAIVDGKLYH